MEYKRLTKRDCIGYVVPVKPITSGYNDNNTLIVKEELLDRLAELEDKIEAGTLIEIPCIRKLNIAGMDCVEAVYIQRNGTIGECVCLNEAEAKKMLEQMKNGI